MNLFEMQAIAGGISREEYCAELLSKNLCNSLNIF